MTSLLTDINVRPVRYVVAPAAGAPAVTVTLTPHGQWSVKPSEPTRGDEKLPIFAGDEPEKALAFAQKLCALLVESQQRQSELERDIAARTDALIAS